MRKKEKNDQDKATVSLILGVVSILTCLWWFLGLATGVLAIIFGVITVGKIKTRGKSLAGIVLGASGVMLSLLVVLVVIVAAPRIQENQNDVSRKSDANMIVSGVVNTISNNNGALPKVGDIGTSSLGVITSIDSTGEPTKTKAIYLPGEWCDGTKDDRDFALKILLENGEVYCTGYNVKDSAASP